MERWQPGRLRPVEYDSDEEIAANLAVLAGILPRDAIVVGSLSRVDGERRRLNAAGGASLVLREGGAFLALARASGWEPGRCLDAPLSHVMSLSTIAQRGARS